MNEEEFKIELERRDRAIALLIFAFKNKMAPEGIEKIISAIQKEFKSI